MGSPSTAPKIKSVNIFLGFFFVVNFCVGTGFLGVPYGFFYSGYLAAIPTLTAVAVIAWINANYLLEVMARAQALEYFERAQKPSRIGDGGNNNSDDDDNITSDQSYLINDSVERHPTFEITLRRKFEVVELCEIFFHRWVKVLYLVILTVYCFLASWSFATVAGSSWALNVPYNFSHSSVVMCDGDKTPPPFLHHVLPVERSCRNAYFFSLFLFAIVVVTLSLVDLKEQALIQMVLGLMRFLTVGAIAIFAIVKLARSGGDDACVERLGPGVVNDTDWWAGPGGAGPRYANFSPVSNATRYFSAKDIVLKFNPVSWLTAVPIFTYAFIMHQGIASLTHPIKQKKYLGYLVLIMVLSAYVSYMLLGVFAPLWFKADVQETVTLSFTRYTSSNNSLGLRILSYYLLLFPSLDVISAYPLVVHTVVNNLYLIILGRDTSRPPSKKYAWHDFSLRLVFRLVVAVLPILAAFSVANLVYVLRYAGLIGFNICFFFPTALQIRSVIVCKRKFAPLSISLSVSSSPTTVAAAAAEEHQSLLGGSVITAAEKSLLSTKRVGGKEQALLYMTPYSYPVLSHPVTASVVGVLGVCFFILTLASLGVHPEKLSCDLT